VDCSITLQVENRGQLIAHSGPHFTHWRRRCLAAFGIAEQG